MQDISAKDRASDKLSWHGTLNSVQARIRLLRSFDQRSHSYLGYVLGVDGVIGDEKREFLVGIGKGAQAKHEFRVGDVVSGQCQPVEDERTETAEFYKVSKLKLLGRGEEQEGAGFAVVWCATGFAEVQGEGASQA